jgi:hypothetical protein
VKQTGHARYYDRLTPMARGDMEESKLLTRTCPRHNYVMNDVGFAGLWQAARELTTLTYMDLSSKVERLRLVEAFGLIIGALAELVSLEAGDTNTRAHALARDMPE